MVPYHPFFFPNAAVLIAVPVAWESTPDCESSLLYERVDMLSNELSASRYGRHRLSGSGRTTRGAGAATARRSVIVNSVSSGGRL
jgi:hypothetical protein